MTNGGPMQIDKDTVVSFIKDHLVDNGKANRARDELPDKVDTHKDAGLLDRFGINAGDLMGKLGDLPGVSGLVGKDKD
jgi:hypothetical protein